MADIVFSVGDPIESRCTKCRKITNHIIVAITDDVPAKVQCNTCEGQHKYRPPAAKKKPAAKRIAKPKELEQKEWQKLFADSEGQQSVPYAMTAAFKTGTVIKHPNFGLGLVQAITGPQKMEVLFEDGKKKLRCL
ncbi:MAG: hypothetical protein OET90_06160 [Desulfuromonadales bacterium]|nr:hypothetical protein [Desulfuromonadales bacterium]